MADVADADRIRAVGELLWGARWQTEMAVALGVPSRTIRFWASGDRTVPAGVWADLRRVCQTRQADIGRAMILLDA